jgi:hypothetical protein
MRVMLGGMTRSIHHWSVTAATAVVVVAGMLLAPAAASASSTSGRCRPDPAVTTFARAELVDRWGRPSGSFVDSRCPDRMLVVRLASRFHYVRHTGVVEPGSVMTFTYARPSTGEIVHTDVATAGSTGVFRTSVTDLTHIMSRGEALTVAAHHESPTPTVLQDIIEYALLA